MKARLLIIGLLTIGCTSPTTKIGTKCKSKGDCNVAMQVCAPGLGATQAICTHVCASNADCPVGYDCTASDPALGRTCNKTLYATDLMTGDPLLFGKPCTGGDDAPCMGTGDPNPAPSCRRGNDPSSGKYLALTQDPHGYCTGSCTTDADCPLPMKCAKDDDGVQKCLKRKVCDDCVYNENCGYSSGNFQSEFTACVPTSNPAGGHYCSKPCIQQGDCPGAAKGSKWMVCSQATDTDGNAGQFCLHWYGACVGKGEICDPCRTTADCSNGTKCEDNPYGLYSYPFTGERMCNKRCAADSDCTGPNHLTCDMADPPTMANPFGKSLLICIPNAARHTGVFACNN